MILNFNESKVLPEIVTGVSKHEDEPVFIEI
jgi:hypothetical protein